MKILAPPSSGSIAGTTFSHNRAGQYTRNRRTPVVGTRTPRQAVVKANMTNSSQMWQTIGGGNQAAWIAYANAHPIVDVLGQSIKLTGAQYFIKCAAALLNVGGTPPLTPPVNSIIVPEVIIGFTVAADGTAFLTRAVGASTDWVGIAIAKYTSLGVNFQKTFSQQLGSPADVEFFDLSAAYDAWTGTPVVGNKAWLRLTPVNSDGLTGSPLIVQTIVATTQALAAAVLTSPLAAHFLATYSTSPTNLSLIVQGALAPAGPWTQVSITAATTSPQSIAATTGQYRRVVLVNTVTGDMSPYSNAILVT